jgi:hypothetical protein
MELQVRGFPPTCGVAAPDLDLVVALARLRVVTRDEDAKPGVRLWASVYEAGGDWRSEPLIANDLLAQSLLLLMPLVIHRPRP